MTLNINVNHYFHGGSSDKEAIAAILQEFRLFNVKLNTMATTLAEIQTELNGVKASLAEERIQIKSKLDEQTAKIDELLAGGGTEEERATLLQDIKNLNTDIRSIIPDAPAEPPVV